METFTRLLAASQGEIAQMGRVVSLFVLARVGSQGVL